MERLSALISVFSNSITTHRIRNSVGLISPIRKSVQKTINRTKENMKKRKTKNFRLDLRVGDLDTLISSVSSLSGKSK